MNKKEENIIEKNMIKKLKHTTKYVICVKAEKTANGWRE